MARRLGALTPRPAEDSKDILDRSVSTSPRLNSHSYPHYTVCLLLSVIGFIIFYSFGNSGLLSHRPAKQGAGTLKFLVTLGISMERNLMLRLAGFHYAHYEKPREIKGAKFGAVEDELSVHRAEDADESVIDFLASRDGELSSRPECRAIICEAVPIIQEVYGKILHRTLHVGPGTCRVVSKLLKEDDVEMWGIQPFDMHEPIHPLCETFGRKGIIRILDPYKPLPYRKKSFSLVLVTGTLDQMKPKELNKTLSDLASVSSHSLMLVVGTKLH